MFVCTPHLSSVAWRLLRLFLPITLVVSLLTPTLTARPVAAAPSADIIYAKPDGTLDASGESWATARDLSAAMQGAVAGDEIWAAQGVYVPLTLAIIYTFQLKSGVAVYGGFAGTESSRGQRDPAKHISVLSGDIDNNDTNKDSAGVISQTTDIVGGNLPHIVNGDDTDSSAVLDGFTITGGNASETGTNPCASCGGGLQMLNGNATLANLVFSGNYALSGGGGMYTDEGSKPRLTHVTFNGNSAGSFGGGMFNHGGSKPTLENSIFSGNGSTYDGGGMSNNVDSTPILADVVFSHNHAGRNGGGMYNVNSDHAVLTNVTFTGNLSGVNERAGGGGMYNNNSNPSLTNVIFEGNQALNMGSGGGMYLNQSNSMLTNVTFSGNRANTGGGLYNETSSPTLMNVVFSGNGANFGGAIDNADSHPVLTNVTLSGNRADYGGAIRSANSTIDLTNTILWANSGIPVYDLGGSTLNFDHSLEEGTSPAGDGNLDGANPANAPDFVRDVNCGTNGCGDDPDMPGDQSTDDDYGDLRLQDASPPVDAGDNSAVASVATDLAGRPRKIAVKRLPATVDMGAYEHVTTPNAVTGGPYNASEGSALVLNGAASSDDVGIVAYAWDCTNNGSTDASAASPTGSSCTYANDGAFTLRLTVTDNVGVTGSATTTVSVANVAPIYSPAPKQSTLAGSAKLFTLGSFTDPGTEGAWPVTVDWGDTSVPTQFNTHGSGGLPGKSHTYAAAGSYSVLVTVNDGKASDDGSFDVTVNPLPPGAPNVTAPADQKATAGIDASFALGSFTDPGSSSWQVSVNWGDGSAATQFSAASPGILPAKPHTYAAADTYDVVVTVSDGVLSAGASFQISASAQENTGSVTGVVFADGNDNGTQEAGEKGVGGAEMTLKTAAEVRAAATELTRTTTSDSSGHYRFDNVPAGNYMLTITAPAGFAREGTGQVALSVQSGKTTTAATFPLKADGGTSSSSLFLPTLQRP